MVKNTKKITIIIPCKNEEQNIKRCLSSIELSIYPKEYIEVLIMDGLSTDKTLDEIALYQKNSELKIKVIQNEKGYQNFGFNKGLEFAKGEIITRLDGHSIINKYFLESSVNYLTVENPSAMAVGCLLETRPQKETYIGLSISIVMSSRFGVGTSAFRTLKQTKKDSFIKVDTAPFCCYKREVFDIVGNYNKLLLNSEDLEFHKRMEKFNIQTYLNTGIRNTYFCRNKYSDFIKHSFRNGKWSILPISLSNHFIFSIRHLIPLFFASGILLGPLFIYFVPFLSYPFFTAILLYGFLAIWNAFQQSRSIKKIRIFPLVFILYFTLHFFYGLGSLSVLGSLVKSKT